MRDRVCVAVLVSWALFTLGCASSFAPATSPGGTIAVPDLSVPGLEDLAMLVLLADRQIYEPFTLERALRSDAEVRRLAALTLGRVPDLQAVALAEQLLADPVPDVRRAAVFALGRLDSEEVEILLLRALSDEDHRTAQLAAGSLARRGETLERVRAHLLRLPGGELAAVASPDLHLFRDLRETGELAALVSSEDPWLRGRAVFALTRRPRPEDRALLRKLLQDGESWIRAMAAEGLGVVGDGEDLEALRTRVESDELIPAIRALHSAGRIVADGRSAPPESWRALLLVCFADRRPSVRVAALESAGAWLLDEELSREMVARARLGSLAERKAALLSLAVAGDRLAGDLTVEAAADPHPVIRAHAASIAGLLGASELLRNLSEDEAARVREAAFEARWQSSEARPALSRYFLEDRDEGVRAAVLRRLADEPVLPFEEITMALGTSLPEVTDLWLNGIDALASRARSEARERGAAVAVLERLATVPSFPIRVHASQALGSLGRPRPAPGPVSTARTLTDYRSIVVRTRSPRYIEVRTELGVFVLRLECRETPLTCLSFVQLVSQGFFDGLSFHRVVPGVRVESGDPRGDGWGGAGFTLRDEPGPQRFQPGSLVMSRSRAHTASSRFAILLSEQPDLEGMHTAFGAVASGFRVVLAVSEGDRILSMREVSAAGIDSD